MNVRAEILRVLEEAKDPVTATYVHGQVVRRTGQQVHHQTIVKALAAASKLDGGAQVTTDGSGYYWRAA